MGVIFTVDAFSPARKSICTCLSIDILPKCQAPYADLMVLDIQQHIKKLFNVKNREPMVPYKYLHNVLFRIQYLQPSKFVKMFQGRESGSINRAQHICKLSLQRKLSLHTVKHASTVDMKSFPESLVNFVYNSKLPDPTLRLINAMKLLIIIFWYSIWIHVLHLRRVAL